MSLRFSFVALTVLALAAATDAVALSPQFEYTQNPEQGNIAYDDVRFETADGVGLHGWFLPFQDQEGGADTRPGPVVILVPPADVNMGDLLWHYHRFLRGTPWHVLVFDWRGYGTSDEWEIPNDQVILPEFVRDLSAAIDFVKTRPEWDEEHIALFGFQMGAAVAMATAAQRDDLSCMVLRGIYTDQASLVANLNTVQSEKTFTVNTEYPAALDPIRVAPQVTVPTLFVAGGEDPVTTLAMTDAVREQFGGKTDRWVAKRAGWKGGDIPEAVKMSEFTARLHAWYRRFIGTGRL